MPELLPIRYGRMLASPFAFFRGAAIMAADLAATPRSGCAQLCGDAHLSNFGGFASPDGELVFDLNDFDETLPGPWEWDLKRLAASLAIAGRDRGLRAEERRRCVAGAAEPIATAMRRSPSRGTSRSGTPAWTSDEILPSVRGALTSAPGATSSATREGAHARTACARWEAHQRVDGEPR